MKVVGILKDFRTQSMWLLLAGVLMLMAIFSALPMSLQAAPAKSDIKVTAHLLKDGSCVVKANNKSSETVKVDVKLTFLGASGKTLGEETTSFFNVPSKATFYDSVSFYNTASDEEASKVKVTYTVSSKSQFLKTPYKSIDKKLSVKITSTEYNDLFDYDKVNLTIYNKTDKNLSGYAVLLFYSGDKLVGSSSVFTNIDAGGERYEERSPFLSSSKYYKITKVKIKQSAVIEASH